MSQIYQPNRGACVRAEHFPVTKLLLLRANSPSELLFVNTRKSCTTSDVLYAIAKKNRRRKLVGLRQNGCDRVLMLDFECVNELGDTVM